MVEMLMNFILYPDILEIAPYRKYYLVIKTLHMQVDCKIPLCWFENKLGIS